MSQLKPILKGQKVRVTNRLGSDTGLVVLASPNFRSLAILMDDKLPVEIIGIDRALGKQVVCLLWMAEYQCYVDVVPPSAMGEDDGRVVMRHEVEVLP